MSVKGLSDRVLLVICDGMGISDNKTKNAVSDAHTPNLDRFLKHSPWKKIIPGGIHVGLPKGVAGNSEVGHMNLGAGRPVRQDLVRINEAIDNDTLKEMPCYKELIQKAKSNSKRIHLMGLLSDGGVHSHNAHLKHILELLKEDSEIEIFYHAFMDGRDTSKTSGEKYLKDILTYKNFHFASMQGRSIGMDRDRRWEKIELAYNTLTGKGAISTKDPISYLQEEYQKELFDEFITPTLFNKDYAIKKDDCVFFLNFRPDRAKQISEVFVSENFSYFDNSIRPAYFLCMTPYIDEQFPQVPILFNKEKVKGTLVEYLSSQKKKVLKIAETEKYAHVTYFFNGGEEKPFDGEERILVNSPKDVATYDLKPQMSAPEVLSKLSEKLEDKSFSLYVVNFANPDMVGHTGNYDASILAMQEVDRCLGELEKKCLNENITMLITADHGNCDQMVYDDGSAHTSHSKADVPFILIHPNKNAKATVSTEDLALKDVAPTILYLLGIEPPTSFTGKTIFN